MGESITCTECGAPLTGRQTAVCSKDCKIKRDARLMDPARRKEIRTGIRQRRKAQMIYTCLVCAQPFGSTIHRSDPRAPKYCSKVCHGLALSERNKGKGPGGKGEPKPKPPRIVIERRCLVCTATFMVTTRSPLTPRCYCSAVCRRLASNARQRNPDPQRPVFQCGVCTQCGVPFIVATWTPTGSSAAAFCSLRCSRRSGRGRRRAAKNGAENERINRQSIFSRDRWRCQLCGKPVKRTAIAPHPHAPVIDHVVPLARGGSHTAANVQLAHFICNSVKGDRTIERGEQLRLIG